MKLKIEVTVDITPEYHAGGKIPAEEMLSEYRYLAEHIEDTLAVRLVRPRGDSFDYPKDLREEALEVSACVVVSDPDRPVVWIDQDLRHAHELWAAFTAVGLGCTDDPAQAVVLVYLGTEPGTLTVDFERLGTEITDSPTLAARTVARHHALADALNCRAMAEANPEDD